MLTITLVESVDICNAAVAVRLRFGALPQRNPVFGEGIEGEEEVTASRQGN